jgi:CubicO group peptidase (beta-lactamase class C family)
MENSRWSRRSALRVLGVTSIAAGGVFASAGSAAAATGAATGRVPAGLRPGGAFDKKLDKLAEEGKLSGTVLLTHQKRTVLSRSYGKANERKSLPNRSDTIFALASVAKLFTATAIMQLAEQGKLDLGQPIGAYLDGFPSAVADAVTVHHLLTHTSGMANFQTSEEFRANAGKWTSGAAMLDGIMGVIRKSALLFTPGTKSSYSNSGFCTLGAIVQEVSGQSFYDYVREHVFDAAGMSRTDYYTRPQQLSDDDIAHPYTTSPAGQRVDTLEHPEQYGSPYIGTPAGDAFTTAPDLERFGRALTGNRLIGPAYTNLMLTGKVPHAKANAGTGSSAQAYGPTSAIRNGQQIIGHGGGSLGTSTLLDVHLDSGWVVVFLFNYADRTTPPIQELIDDTRKLITTAAK